MRKLYPHVMRKVFFGAMTAIIGLLIWSVAYSASRPIAYVPLGTGVIKVQNGTEQDAATPIVLSSTNDVSGTLPIGNGGTGQVSFGSGIIHSNGTTLSSSAVALGGSDVSGTLGIVNGGTGQTSFAAGTLISDGGTISSLAPGTSGNVLTSNGTAWTSAAAPSSGWTTLLDLDFTAESTQTIGANGNYTIGGKTWKKENAANEVVSMQITNGTGLVIKPNASAYGSGSRTAPLIWLAFSQLTTTVDFTLMGNLRIWLQLISWTTTGGGNGSKVFSGVDTDSLSYSHSLAWNMFPSYPTAIQMNLATNVNGSAATANTAGGDNNPDITTNKVMVMQIPGIGTGEPPPIFVSKGAYSSGWPSPKTGLTPFLGIFPTNAFGTNMPKFFPADVTTGFGIVLGAMSSGSVGDIFTVARLRVDYLP